MDKPVGACHINFSEARESAFHSFLLRKLHAFVLAGRLLKWVGEFCKQQDSLFSSRGWARSNTLVVKE